MQQLARGAELCVRGVGGGGQEVAESQVVRAILIKEFRFSTKDKGGLEAAVSWVLRVFKSSF